MCLCSTQIYILVKSIPDLHMRILCASYTAKGAFEVWQQGGDQQVSKPMMLNAQDPISTGFNIDRVQIGRDHAQLDDNRVNGSESVLLQLVVKHLQGERKSAGLFLIMLAGDQRHARLLQQRWRLADVQQQLNGADIPCTIWPAFAPPREGMGHGGRRAGRRAMGSGCMG